MDNDGGNTVAIIFRIISVHDSIHEPRLWYEFQTEEANTVSQLLEDTSNWLIETDDSGIMIKSPTVSAIRLIKCHERNCKNNWVKDSELTL